MDVILYEPQIPQNTGNIVRTCSVSGSCLHLVRPLGFSVANRKLKRAGLDYWEDVDINFIDDLRFFLENAPNRFFFFSAHAKSVYSDIAYKENDFLIFGSETSGLPQELWHLWPEKFYTIPQREAARCLNLANAVSIVLYEAWRQQNFAMR